MDELTKQALLSNKAKLEAEHVDSIIETVEENTEIAKDESSQMLNDCLSTVGKLIQEDYAAVNEETTAENEDAKNETFNKLFNDLQRTKKYMFVNFFSPIGHVGLKATDVEMCEDDRGEYIVISLEGYNHAYIDYDYEIHLHDYCDNHIKYTVYPSVSRYKGECFDICIEFLGGD